MIHSSNSEGESIIPEDEIFEIFEARSSNVDGHDPWRYGEDVSALTDSVEVEWLVSRFKFLPDDVVVDVGCGTGRHAIQLSQKINCKAIFACDFIDKNIHFLNNQADILSLENLYGVVCNGAKFADFIDIDRCDYILGIGFIQYLTTDSELDSFAECCSRLLNSGGYLILKHPLSFVQTYLLDYYREDMQTRYISKYYDLNDLMRPFLKNFDLLSIERTFNESNVGPLLGQIEVDERARQMWIHLVKK